MKSTFCVVEDRDAWEPSIKLLLLSLGACAPTSEVNLFYPRAQREFRAWADHRPKLTVRRERLKATGWNVKPEAVLALIREGYEEVIWVDSDIVALRDPGLLFSGLDLQTFATTVDTPAAQRNGTAALRAKLWGLDVGRELPFNPNLGVFRATNQHSKLLELWSEMVGRGEYLRCQEMEWKTRPLHMMGDHDPLAALLSSTQFSAVPVRYIRLNADIVHFDGVYGYPTAARMRHLFGNPPVFVHSMGNKPWAYRWKGSASEPREWLKDRYFDISPYTLWAMRFRHELDCDTSWMDAHYALSRFMRALGGGLPPLSGLPMAVAFDLSGLLARLRLGLKGRNRTKAALGLAGGEEKGNAVTPSKG